MKDSLIDDIPLERLAEAMRRPSHYAFRVSCPECKNNMENCLSESLLSTMKNGFIDGIPDKDLFRCPNCGKEFELSLNYRLIIG